MTWYKACVITLCYIAEPCWWKAEIILIGLMSICVYINMTLCWSLVAHTTAVRETFIYQQQNNYNNDLLMQCKLRFSPSDAE